MSKTSVFFWVKAIGEKPQDSHRERGTASGDKNECRLIKSYVRLNIVVNENARDLPKCSKSLHFCQTAGEEEGFDASEEKANKTEEVGRLFAGLVLGMDERTSLLSGLLGYLPEIWPLRCSPKEIKQ